MTTTDARILILESNPADADAVEVQLHKASISCVTRRIATKELFLRAMVDFGPSLIIANATIPRFDTLAALTQARVQRPDIPWIFISSVPNEDLAVSCLKAGAVDYINKKHMNRLGVSVQQALGKRSEFPAALQQEPKGESPQKGKSTPTADEVEKEHAEGDPMAGLSRTLVEDSQDLIAILDVDGKRIYNNRAYARVLEDPESLRGTDSFLDVHPEDREMVKQAFHESLRTGVGKRLEYRLLDLEGDFRYIESQGTVLHGPDGKLAALCVISHDITRRKRTFTALENLVAGTSSVWGDDFFPALVRHLAHALDVRYALVSESIPPKNDRVRVLSYWANEQWTSRFEYDVADTTCEKVLLEGKMCYFPEHVQTLFPKENALVAMKAVCYLAIPLFHSSGDVIGHMFIMDDKPLPDFQQARFVMSVFAARAAMELERKRAMTDLREQEGLYRSILGSLNDAIVLTDMSDLIIYSNANLAHLTGYTVQEIIGRTWSTLFLPEEEWESLQRRNKDRMKGLSERYQTRLKKKDGSELLVTVSAAPYRDVNGHIMGTLGVLLPQGPAGA